MKRIMNNCKTKGNKVCDFNEKKTKSTRKLQIWTRKSAPWWVLRWLQIFWPDTHKIRGVSGVQQVHYRSRLHKVLKVAITSLF